MISKRTVSRHRRWAAALITVVALGSLAACGGDDDAADDGPAVAAANEGIDGVLAIRIASSPKHTEEKVEYDRHPPAGGDHNPRPAQCGFYDEPVADEAAVHSLEHGAVWLAYSPTLPEADLEVLRTVVEDEDKTIATPYEGLDPGVAVVVTAWARQLTLESVSDPRLVEFIEQYRSGDQAPEADIKCPERSGD